MRRGLSAGIAAAVLTILPAPPASAAVAVERIFGADRYATAIAVARRGWRDGAGAVVLAGGRDHRDALAAAGLAGRLGRVPVLLTPPEALRDDVRAELLRLRPSRVHLVGGEVAVSSHVESAVRQVAAAVTRYAGVDAPATAAEVAATFPVGGEAAFVVHPGDAAAGVSAGALAAARGLPVLLAGDALRPALDRLRPQSTFVVGAAAPDLPGATRLVGQDVFATGVAVAEQAARWGLNVRHAVLASSWTDGVSAAALAGRFDAPLLLTDPAVWHGRMEDWFRFADPVGATIVGGDRAVDSLLAALVVEGGGAMARGPGSSGPVVSAIQQRLVEIGFHPDGPDGSYGGQTRFALYALQKAFGLPVTGSVGEAELAVLRARQHPPVLRPDITASHGDHVEISLGRQLVQVVRDGVVRWSVHTSTGKPSTPTITGLFRILDHRPGFNALGMYMTMHFRGGYAIHGYGSVPLQPASHGCARLTYRDAELLYAEVPDGMPVIVWR